MNRVFSKRIAFTIFLDCDEYKAPNLEKFTYLLYCLETCPTTGRKHIQGFAVTKAAMRLKAIQDALGYTCHIENCKGTPQQNYDYCTKEGKILLEHGKLPESTQGKRNDIVAVNEIFKSGQNPNVSQLIDMGITSAPALKIYEKLQSLQKPKFRDITVYWFYGPSGTGKTHAAYEILDEMDYWVKPSRTRFYDGYTGQQTVLFDDLRPNSIGFTELLQLMDKYPCSVDAKGTPSIPWCCTTLIITTIMHPDTFTPPIEDKKQLTRRITYLKNFAPEE